MPIKSKQIGEQRNGSHIITGTFTQLVGADYDQDLSPRSSCWTQIVLSTSPGNLPAVRVWSSRMSRFGSRPVQKPDPMPLGGSTPDPYLSTCTFYRVWIHPSVPISGSAFRVSHVRSPLHMLLEFIQYRYWYFRVCFWPTGCLNDQNEERHVPYDVLKMSANGVSTIVGHVSWVIWGATGYTQS